ncbi:MAG: hypothetical protein ACE14V_16445, partial [bacterium]
MAIIPCFLWFYRATHSLSLYDIITVGEYKYLSYYLTCFRLDFWKVIGNNLSKFVLTPIGVVLVLLGMLLKTKIYTRWFLYIWLVAVILFLALFPFGTYLHLHIYTYLPMVPIAAIFAGKTLEFISNRINRSIYPIGIIVSMGLLIIMGVLGFRTIKLWYFYSERSYLVGKSVDQITSKDRMVITLRQVMNPELLYYCDRRGWIVQYEQFSIQTVESLRKIGATHVATSRLDENNEAISYLLHHYEPIKYNPEYFLFQIDKWYDQPSCIVTNPKMQYPVDAIFGRKFKLLGYDLEKSKVRAGESSIVTFYWQTLGQNTSHYDFFVNVELQYSQQTVYKKERRNLFRRFWGYLPNHTTGVGKWISTRTYLLAEPNSWVVSGIAPIYPSAKWQVGQIIKVDYELFAPIDAIPGVYRIYTGVRNEQQRLTMEPASVSDSAARFIGPNLEISRNPDFIYKPMSREEIKDSLRFEDSPTISNDQIERETLRTWKISKGTLVFTHATKHVFLNKIKAVYKDGIPMKLLTDRNPTLPDEARVLYFTRWINGHRIYINDGVNTQPTAKYEVEYYPALPQFVEPTIREPLKNWQVSHGTRVFTQADQFITDDKFITVYKNRKKMQVVFNKPPSQPEEAGIYFGSQWINNHRIYIDDKQSTSPQALYEIEYYRSDATSTHATNTPKPTPVMARQNMP